MGHGDDLPPSRDQLIDRECRLMCDLVLIPLWWCRSFTRTDIRTVVVACRDCFPLIMPRSRAPLRPEHRAQIAHQYWEIHDHVKKLSNREGDGSSVDVVELVKAPLREFFGGRTLTDQSSEREWVKLALDKVKPERAEISDEIHATIGSCLYVSSADDELAQELFNIIKDTEIGLRPPRPALTVSTQAEHRPRHPSRSGMTVKQSPGPGPVFPTKLNSDQPLLRLPPERPPEANAAASRSRPPPLSAPVPPPPPFPIAPAVPQPLVSDVGFALSEIDRFARAADDLRDTHGPQILHSLVERANLRQASRPHALEEVRWPTAADDPGVWVLSSAALTARFDVWFAGDIHGDLAALEAIVSHALGHTSPGKLPCVVLLGDLCDDGPHSHEVVVRVLELMLDDRLRLCLVRGNHDEALSFDEASSTFRSTVDPAQYCEWLNRQPPDSAEHEVARCMIKIWDTAPRAVFVHHPEGGLLAVHGGVPHTDLYGTIRACYRDGQPPFSSPRCHLDFVWLRMHSRAKKRLPNRLSKTCELGIEDVIGFCDLVREMLGFPVATIIRGHDHVEERYEVLTKYEPLRVVTINSMSRRLEREASTGGTDLRTPCIARWKPGTPLEIVRLALHGSAGVAPIHGVGGTP